MRLNESTAIVTNKLVFVPYEASHVPTYSEWMSSEALREATASERLSLPEEYAMQKSWREDADKLTFILSSPSNGIQSLNNSDDASRKGYTVIEGIDDEPSNLIGDVNLFLYEDDDDDDDEQTEVVANGIAMVGEIELMVARDEYQGQGLGKVAVLVFILYVLRHQQDILMQDMARYEKGGRILKHLRVKIGKENIRSLGLFQKLGFKKTTEEPNYFGEWELRLKLQPLNEVENGVEDILRDCGVEWREEVEFKRV
ncbi:hypothetical protein TWF225_008803 [Orbilia oligospora]|uniref:Uncharacterized protein n=1 Tax=Orbilia oligospora TaxID=2813651 RepID=A0A7C8U7G0_ORBOL|nr:hypothetical protein TWF225_008803 [Orbilia oligospora]KAF3181383.1 hypothetical protein TWF751_009330 [Orbilia oligospora]KAF3254604.1 hypothetical protein TWF217_006821 [Orbilia oligospora]KAF3259247.1 hypothetical protein TWF128_004330 [Orbilia oligospora]TGJ68881.1 hypothetical protein EYR41_004961 [Orbilia oligospora]